MAEKLVSLKKRGGGSDVTDCFTIVSTSSSYTVSAEGRYLGMAFGYASSGSAGVPQKNGSSISSYTRTSLSNSRMALLADYGVCAVGDVLSVSGFGSEFQYIRITE